MKTAPAGHVYVRDTTSGTHVAPFGVGCLVAPALCGRFPATSWNPVTHDWDGPARWTDVRREAGDAALICPRCLEVAG